MPSTKRWLGEVFSRRMHLVSFSWYLGKAVVLALLNYIAGVKPPAITRSASDLHLATTVTDDLAVCFSNRPFEVKRVQIIHYHSVHVARGRMLYWEFGATATPAWNSKTRLNNLKSGLAIS